MSKELYIGKNKVSEQKKDVNGTTVILGNELFFKITNSNLMRPFFMSIVSDANHWMFISSNGGVSAGRKDCDLALFPYYTDDKITESAAITGSKTILQIHKKNKIVLWEPFSDNYQGIYNIQRNLYKSQYGNKIIFEEINKDLGLTYSYQWSTSNLYGFVKKATLTNNTFKKVAVKVLDGLQNIVPYGVNATLQNEKSNLVDAYKKSELLKNTGLGLFMLSAIIVDKAEPSEALKATTVWSSGLKNPMYLLSSLQLNNFRKGISLKQEVDIRAEKGAYFTVASFQLKGKTKKHWSFVANVNQSATKVAEISEKLNAKKTFLTEVEKSIELGTQNLIKLAGNADGLQLSSDQLKNTRHFSNTLFNCMRGGIFDENYLIEAQDFKNYILKANKKVHKEQQAILNNLPLTFSLNKLKEIATTSNNSDFIRLSFEYMPLRFSRRHGDPSRPWNKFSINTTNEIDGSKILDYQGNWRDIFQNWEALAYSYPNFIENMIFKFLNATTFEGYNPYRVTKDGFDWETVEPDDPWSFIGYWGDHQIIYLLKFLEFAENHFPNKLAKYFNQSIFVYANVPYKIKNYTETLKNPKDTIDFDIDLDKKIRERRLQIGADGALLLNQNKSIYKVNLLEKLLATVLAKVSNFIPEAGIWLNTQRPEWNDANNALVGNGVSMVTLYYLRRFISFFKEIIYKNDIETIEVSVEMEQFFTEIVATLQQHKNNLNNQFSNTERKKILDGLGAAGSNFRTKIYNQSFSGKTQSINKSSLLNFTEIVLQYINHSIKANKRKDNLYHAYNLISVENNNEIAISYLPEMLEGQVSVLSSGYLSAKESLLLLENLKKSALYRKDQFSYLLYPNKELPKFVEKNNIPSLKIEKSALIKQLLNDKNYQIVEKDVAGKYHFNGSFNNATSLTLALDNLPSKYSKLVNEDKKLLLTIFEEVFNHKYFTGRSGTFFGYEGLGSIYWHMVSKLVLAVQEVCVKAINTNEEAKVIEKLMTHFYELNEGIGVHKSPKLYGAFPTDPYSHTPAGKGAQQPGMTGQVKEDILIRFGELGIFVNNGKLSFKPKLLKFDEFFTEQATFTYTNVFQQKQQINLAEKSLCFTYCQTPIIYQLSTKNEVQILQKDGSLKKCKSLELGEEISLEIFNRSGVVKQLTVLIKSNSK
jgi:hypothetical protein